MTSPAAADDRIPDPQFAARYAALSARDARFDGQFIAGVLTTGIYCRPSCPAATPRPQNVRFFRTAAAAHEAGLRACKRCQPDAVPGSPEWKLRDDLAARAMRLIDDGVVERDGVPGLARRLGYTPRHLTRVLSAELGAGPLALARARRAQTARTLLAATELPIVDVAFAAGFGSVRSFHETIAEVYRTSPGELRQLARRPGRPAAPSARDAEPLGTALTLRLPARAPFDGAGLLRFFAEHAVPGVEHADGEQLHRLLPLPGGLAEVRIRLDRDRPGLVVEARLAQLSDVTALTARVRRMFDLDADSVAIDEALASDPRLAPLVAARPGLRIPGSAEPGEALVRALVGQQISLAAARTQLGRLVAELGEAPTAGHREAASAEASVGSSALRAFPRAAEIAERGESVLRGPAARRRSILAAAEALAAERLPLGPETPVAELRARLLALPGIGPWTADYLAMRVLGHPDVLLVDDLVVRRSAEALGIAPGRGPLAAAAAAWSPWRSYATLHLWAARP